MFGFASFDSLKELIPGLFVGAMMTATSVGITARVLGDLGELNSREGVTILGGAVVDDVLGNFDIGNNCRYECNWSSFSVKYCNNCC